MDQNQTDAAIPVAMPRIGAPLGDGIFAGIARGEEGDHALILLAEAPKKLNWKDATAWAEGLGATLPTRAEQAVIFAWSQLFYCGTQYYYPQVIELRARAVRRWPLTSSTL